MSNRKKIASIAFTGAAAAVAIGANVGPAAAASGTWYIWEHYGAASQAHYAGPFSGNATSGTVLLATSKGGGSIPLTCTTAHGQGSFPNSTVTSTSPFTKLATLSGNGKYASSGGQTTFGSNSKPCSVAGIGFKATLDNNVSFSAAHNGYNATTGVTTGRVHGTINATLHGTPTGGVPNCVMTVTGSTVPGSYNNNSATLNINQGKSKTLQIATLNGSCGIVSSLISPGAPAGFTAKYKAVTPPGLGISDP